MPNMAVIDIGSNAIRLVIGHVNGKGRIKREVKLRAPVRLGADSFSRDRRISEENLERTVSAFRKFKKQCRAFKITKMRAVATSALREASNRAWFLEEVYARTGISIDIIDGLEEARLIQMAVRRKCDLSRKTALIMDIGGGSVEFAVCKNGKTLRVDSLRMGTLRLLAKAGKGRPSQARYREILGPLAARISQLCRGHKVELFIGTGGNVECLTYLRRKILRKADNLQVRKDELKRIVDVLFSLGYEERVHLLGLKPDRADVILPAAMTCATVLSRLATDTLHIPKVGLREGALADLVRPEDLARSLSRRPRPTAR